MLTRVVAFVKGVLDSDTGNVVRVLDGVVLLVGPEGVVLVLVVGVQHVNTGVVMLLGVVSVVPVIGVVGVEVVKVADVVPLVSGVNGVVDVKVLGVVRERVLTGGVV
ncbi:hypothetical protein RvY_02636 [Ramazzottius varieornatus]|uniref:Uncharacterized protein n=1 Tax=Ramazzottius varieornatus TaxID=947166 RepID=A0A1D1UL63_RAMVA|nr:hypothetical protein RvY_02636 [Ramazzottius varieornatus]